MQPTPSVTPTIQQHLLDSTGKGDCWLLGSRKLYRGKPYAPPPGILVTTQNIFSCVVRVLLFCVKTQESARARKASSDDDDDYEAHAHTSVVETLCDALRNQIFSSDVTSC